MPPMHESKRRTRAGSARPTTLCTTDLKIPIVGAEAKGAAGFDRAESANQFIADRLGKTVPFRQSLPTLRFAAGRSACGDARIR